MMPRFADNILSSALPTDSAGLLIFAITCDEMITHGYFNKRELPNKCSSSTRQTNDNDRLTVKPDPAVAINNAAKPSSAALPPSTATVSGDGICKDQEAKRWNDDGDCGIEAVSSQVVNRSPTDQQTGLSQSTRVFTRIKALCFTTRIRGLFVMLTYLSGSE
ncbi:hypothetical protein M8C21_019880 [Ambrosia artemisiifolia]|uniref:Uncharacterized protein n=1 Tax=Ambrosia artemisiifolia TaxID=4212 RepID=A0AAD5GHK6_AMBAR|nr:hypothetical protein M8C21_019880 [Ambrosia artemisiifolia]